VAFARTTSSSISNNICGTSGGRIKESVDNIGLTVFSALINEETTGRGTAGTVSNKYIKKVRRC